MAVDWTCESIRLSLFSSQAVRLSVEDWKRLTGQDEPEQEQKVASRHVFASSFFGGQLSLGAIANRCDFVLSPTPQAELPEGQIPSVGQWPSALEEYSKVIEPFLETVPFPVTRMAFAPVLVHPVKERVEAYKALISLVKSLKLTPETTHDLLFRINRPTNSTSDNELTLNRLTTWSVLQYQLQMFVSDGNSPASFVSELTYALRLELDHNTDQKRTEAFDVARLVPIYKDLTNLALQNAREGEVL